MTPPVPHSFWKIGMEFTIGSKAGARRCRVTDVGQRTLVAIRLDVDNPKEFLLDEQELEFCYPVEMVAVIKGVVSHFDDAFVTITYQATDGRNMDMVLSRELVPNEVIKAFNPVWIESNKQQIVITERERTEVKTEPVPDEIVKWIKSLR